MAGAGRRHQPDRGDRRQPDERAAMDRRRADGPAQRARRVRRAVERLRRAGHLRANGALPRSALGIVLSAELVGMGFGSVILGGVADKFGRKPTMLLCLVLMADGHVPGQHRRRRAAADRLAVHHRARHRRHARRDQRGDRRELDQQVGAASPWRLCDRLSARRRDRRVRGVRTGCSTAYGWRGVFLFGAIVTAAMIPLVLLLVPETAGLLRRAARRERWSEINRSLRALRKPAIAGDAAGRRDRRRSRKSPTSCRNPQLRPVTLLLAFGYMFHTITFYYILKFAVQIVADYRLSRQPEAASALTWANIGGATGGALFGFLMTKWDIKWPTIAAAADRLGGGGRVRHGQRHAGGWRVATFLTGVLHQRRDRRLLCRLRARLPGLCPRDRHRLRARHRPRSARRARRSSPASLFTWLGNDELLTVSAIMAMGSIVVAGAVPACCPSAKATTARRRTRRRLSRPEGSTVDEDPRRRRLRGQAAARDRRARPRRARRPARCWSRSWRPASATPTPTRSTGSTPRASSPRSSATRARAWCARSAPGVTSVKPGDHVIPLYTPECRQCKSCLSRQDQPVHRDPRHPGQGADARRDQPVLATRARRSSTTWAARPSRTSPCCPRSRWRRSARTRRSRPAATSAAA